MLTRREHEARGGHRASEGFNRKLAVLTAELNEAMSDKATAEAAVAKGMQKLTSRSACVRSRPKRKMEGVGSADGDRPQSTHGRRTTSLSFYQLRGTPTAGRDTLMSFRRPVEGLWGLGGHRGPRLRAPPMSRVPNPIAVLATDAEIASWNRILYRRTPCLRRTAHRSNTARWPLIIDPPTQGISWLRHKEGHAAMPDRTIRSKRHDAETREALRVVTRSSSRTSASRWMPCWLLLFKEPRSRGAGRCT